MSYIQRNYNIVEQKMIAQTDLSLGYGRDLIDSELNVGLLNFVIKPIVKSFYKHWSDNEARVGTLKQIHITLDSAKLLIENGTISKEKFDDVINRKFPSYLENDQTDRQCKKNHKHYKKLKEITKKSFISQVEECILFLQVKEVIKDYNELSRATFKSKEKALQALMRQLDFNDEGIAIVEQDDTIIDVPAGRNIIVKVLRKAFELTKKKLIEELDFIFHKK
jgi:transcriptional regulator with PAS, ATPase and Fis domain